MSEEGRNGEKENSLYRDSRNTRHACWCLGQRAVPYVQQRVARVLDARATRRRAVWKLNEQTCEVLDSTKLTEGSTNGAAKFQLSAIWDVSLASQDCMRS